MSGQRTLILLTLTLLLSSTISLADPCMGLPLYACLSRIEAELNRCRQAVRNDLDRKPYLWVGGQGIKEKPFNIFDPKESKFHPLTINAYELIATHAGGVAGNRDKLKVLHRIVVESYQMARLNVRDAANYHNLCLGLHNMFYSGLIYYHTFTSGGFLIEDDKNMASVMLAGLFSHAFYEKYSYESYLADAALQRRIYTALQTSIEAVFLIDVDREFPYPEAVATEMLLSKAEILDGADANIGVDTFRFGKIQAIFVKHVLKAIWNKEDADINALVLDSLLAKDHKSELKNHKPLWDAFFALDMDDVDDGHVRPIINSFNLGNHTPITSFVRAADKTAQASVTREYLMTLIQGQVMEHLLEVDSFRFDGGDPHLQLDAWPKSCQATFTGIYRAQATSAGTLVAEFLAETFLYSGTTDEMLDGFAKIVTEYDENKTENPEDQVTKDYNKAQAIYDLINDDDGTTYTDLIRHTIAGVDAIEYVVALREMVTNNIAFFNSNIRTPPADDTAERDYFPISKNAFDAFCP